MYHMLLFTALRPPFRLFARPLTSSARARLQGAVFFIIAVSGGNVNHGWREIPI
jgi:hypothetical protein